MADLRYQVREPIVYVTALTDKGREFLRLYDARDKAMRVMPLSEFPFAFDQEHGDELLKLARAAELAVEQVTFVAPSRIENRLGWIWAR